MEPADPWHLKDRLPARWTRLEFQPRDLEFLKILLEQKFLSRDQITNFIFDGKERYGEIRVWKMRRFGFVDWVRGFHPHGLFLPNAKTYDYFKSRYVDVPLPVACPDPRTIFHDLLLTDIRFLFREMGFGSSWTSERVWRMGRSVRLWAPDAVIEVGGDTFAIEVERVQKESVRYEDIFGRYQNDPEITACLYLTDENLLPLLLEKAERYPAIYFTSRVELFEKKEKTVFRNSKGSMLEIGENLERNLQTEKG
jgi:hypothetical protein